MGLNIAGLLTNRKIDEQEICHLIENEITYSGEVGFEEATSSFRDENTIDVLQTEKGTLIFTEMGFPLHISDFKGEIIQFIISDVSDTYYFEKYTNGNLDRKYIYSQGEIFEDEGEGIIKEDEDMMDLVWEFCEKYLQNNFSETMFGQKFKRYSFA
ncbi:hypothetical protein [Capnocytophaga felis]|uniref:Uncharacterized protein n=1 Tax=Capnocytophaga felis TaxID=2267611 RepID=A0A5M4B7R6_9FLAO|nr:hypothetical protein [Capnocytophaga felis]GET45641.1 hypothetical protein RCZ01_09430 [Capnocytophaga felis]GET47196.1 hypothetical protein RCZ02_00270 [Capnocytophaga felis]